MSDLWVGLLGQESLRSEIRALVATAPGELSVVVIGAGGVIVDLDGGRVVPAASTIKVPILVTALERVAQGASRLQEPIAFGSDRVGGSGALSLLASVTQLPLIETLRLMIALSDTTPPMRSSGWLDSRPLARPVGVLA